MRNTEPRHASERTPVRLGRYEIVQKLGAGGMADVYLAHQPGPFSASKLIVIKQLRAGVMDDEQFVQMFADESRIAVRLNHPNVVHTYEAVADGHDYYLVLEFLDGKSLYQVLNQVTRVRMPLALHLWILTQVLAGLHHAHELKEFDGSPMGVVHRDVSPSNVFITNDGDVKLLDFGIAKSVGASTATREGIIKGKLGYAAPEQCLCRATDRRTDVFAIGVMLWEAVAGRRRPMGETEASTYQARIQGTELRIEDAVPMAPPEIVSICNRALARHPDERFSTALEFRQAIERYLQSIGWDDGSAQLRSFMHEHFSVEIDQMRQRIDEHLGRSRATGVNLNTQIGSASLSPSPYPCVEGSNQQRAALLGHDRAAVAQWLRRPLARGAIVASSVITVVLVSWLGSARTATNGSDTVASTHASAASAVPPVPGLSVSQPVAQVTVSLAAKPGLAELRLDGRQISNPYRAVHGRDKAPHHLTVSLAGYETSEQDLLFDDDVGITVTLSSRTQTGKSVAAARAPRSMLPRPASNKDSKSQLPSVAENPQPGDALNGSKKARKIDESDPYGR